MSNHATHTAEHASDAHAATAPLFSAVEIEQFEADDVTAGRAIGKMLSSLFLYTVIVMSLVSWWTYRTVNGPAAASDAAPAESH
ncbi:MAG: hypothetical protein JNL58_18255 [Planctomyces sp.]|nr:hypothetical protein [Planctomyces sp.]